MSWDTRLVLKDRVGSHELSDLVCPLDIRECDMVQSVDLMPLRYELCTEGHAGSYSWYDQSLPVLPFGVYQIGLELMGVAVIVSLFGPAWRRGWRLSSGVRLMP